MRTLAHRRGDDAARLLEHGLADPAPWVRYYACQGLGRLEARAAAPRVIACLADAAPHVRIAAIEALGHFDVPEAWQALTAAASSPDLDDQRAALASIALHARAQALPFLLAGTRADDVAARLIALSGLARRAEPEGIEALAAAAMHGEPEVREAALSLLGDRSDLDAAAALVAVALASPVDHTSRIAEARGVDHPALRTLSRAGVARVAAIGLRLAGADDRAAELLVGALARMHDPGATALIYTALGLTNPAVRRAAASALVALDDQAARATLARLAADDADLEVRRIAAAASIDPP